MEDYEKTIQIIVIKNGACGTFRAEPQRLIKIEGISSGLLF